MTVDAGPVPAIERAGPMISRAGFCGLARAEPEPFPFVRIPGDIERLQPAAADVDEILLQRFVGECVFDLEFAFLAVRPFGADEDTGRPRLKNVVSMPSCSKLAPSKFARTVLSSATAIALAWFDLAKAAAWSAWQEAHFFSSTNPS